MEGKPSMSPGTSASRLFLRRPLVEFSQFIASCLFSTDSEPKLLSAQKPVCGSVCVGLRVFRKPFCHCPHLLGLIILSVLISHITFQMELELKPGNFSLMQVARVSQRYLEWTPQSDFPGLVFSRPQRGHVERHLGKRQEEKGARIEAGMKER